MRLGIERAGKAPEFVSGQETSEPIRQVHSLLAYLDVLVEGSLVITGGSGAGSYHTDAAHRVLRSLAVDYDGGTRIRVQGVDLATMEALFEPQPMVQTFPSSLAAGTYPISVLYRIPFLMPFAHQTQRERFALPVKLVDTPLLKIEAGAPGDLTYGATDYSGIAFSGMTVQVYERPLLGIAPPRVGEYFPLLLNSTTYRLAGDVSSETHELTGFQGVPGTRELRAVIATAAAHGAGETDYRASNSILLKLGIHIPGVEKIDPVTASLIQRHNAQVYNRTSVRTGVYVLDAAENQNVAPHELWRLLQGQRPYVTFDADHNGSNGDHIVRFLTISTAGRVPPA